MTKTKLKKNSKRISKELFLKEIELVKKDLPKNYGVILKHIYPEIDMRQLYNVVHYGVHNEEILQKMKFIVPSKN